MTDGIIQKVINQFLYNNYNSPDSIVAKRIRKLERELIENIKYSFSERECELCKCDMCLENLTILQILIGDNK